MSSPTAPQASSPAESRSSRAVPRSPIRLICLDVDGTLVGASGRPTDGVWEAAARARAGGIHLALSTARIAIGDAWTWATRLDPDGWHLFQTGASIVHSATRDTHSTPLPHGALDACARTASARDWILELYSDFDYTVDDGSDAAVAHAGLLGVAYERRPASSLRGAAVRAQFIVADDDLDDAVAAAPAGCTASAATSPLMPGWNFVSITADTVSKASGIRVLAEILGLSVDEVMMVGDGQNDVSALQAAGFAVAMGNAHADAVAVSDRVVSDVEHDGVADAIGIALDSHARIPLP